MIQISAALVIALAACGGASATFTEDGIDSTFTSGSFQMEGDLRLPDGKGPFPAVIIVHGDGPQTRTGSGLYAPVIDLAVDAGYAVFSWDKPGTGGSTGSFESGETLRQRADILVDAVALLGGDERIDADRIGVWGISQAGWVVPLALDQTDDIAFMIMVSGGAEESPNQMGYLIGAQMRCAGHSEEEASSADAAFVQYANARTYEDYREAMEIITGFPTAAQYGGDEVRAEENWSPWPEDADAFFDPVTVLEETTIPVLAFFGSKDTAVDPVQGSSAYIDALTRAGNPDFEVHLIEDVGHIMKPMNTGCFSEAATGAFSSEYLGPMDAWLRRMAEA